jgi:hypothetical protein
VKLFIKIQSASPHSNPLVEETSLVVVNEIKQMILQEKITSLRNRKNIQILWKRRGTGNIFSQHTHTLCFSNICYTYLHLDPSIQNKPKINN